MADLSWHQNRIREGNRGGREEFKWESIKEMEFKDRECYLGASTKVGMMGKHGRFNEQNWYIKQREKTTTIDEERDAVNKFEQEIMQEALGLKPKKILLQKHQMTPEQMKEYFKEEKKRTKEERTKEEGNSVAAGSGLGFAPHRTAELEEKKSHVLGLKAELEGSGEACGSSMKLEAELKKEDDKMEDDVKMEDEIKMEDSKRASGRSSSSSSSSSDDKVLKAAKKAEKVAKKMLKKELKRQKKVKKKEKKERKKRR